MNYKIQNFLKKRSLISAKMNNAKQRKKEPKTIPPTPIYFFL